MQQDIQTADVKCTYENKLHPYDYKIHCVQKKHPRYVFFYISMENL